MINASYTIMALAVALLLIGATVVSAVSAELRVPKKIIHVKMHKENSSPPKYVEPEKPVITIGKGFEFNTESSPSDRPAGIP